jgi:hypothetical protein
MDDDIHERLVKQYLEYFKDHEAFERAPSVRNYRHIRRSLKAMKELVNQRYHETKTIYLAEKPNRQIPNNARIQKGKKNKE